MRRVYLELVLFVPGPRVDLCTAAQGTSECGTAMSWLTKCNFQFMIQLLQVSLNAVLAHHAVHGLRVCGKVLLQVLMLARC